MTITVGLWSWKFHHFWLLWDVCGVGVCHAAQIVVDELIFKLLCSYRRGNQAWEKKKEEEEIRPVWPSYILSLSPSKRNQTSKTGNRRNQYKQPTANSRHRDIGQRPTAAPWQWSFLPQWILHHQLKNAYRKQTVSSESEIHCQCCAGSTPICWQYLPGSHQWASE